MSSCSWSQSPSGALHSAFLARTGVDACESWQLWRLDGCDALVPRRVRHLNPETPRNLVFGNICEQVRS